MPEPATPSTATPDAATRAGITTARIKLGSLVYATSLRNLSHMDRAFLAVMARDDGPSHVSAIAARLNREPGYVGMYRDRLLRVGMIKAVGRGQLDYAAAYLRDYGICQGE